MGNVQAQSLKHRALSISSIQLSLLGTVVEQSIFRPTLEGRHGVDTKRSRTVDTADRPLSAATAPFLCRCGRGPWRGLPATRGSQQSRIDWARALTRFRQCLRPKSLSRSRPAITVSLASWSGFRGETQTDCTVRFLGHLQQLFLECQSQRNLEASRPQRRQDKPLCVCARFHHSCAPATWLPYGENRSSTRSRRRPTTQVPSCNTPSNLKCRTIKRHIPCPSHDVT